MTDTFYDKQNIVVENIDRLTRQTFDQLQARMVTAVVIALGSNDQAEQHLATVRQRLSELGEMQLSTPYQNPDITATPAQPKPDYVNQCAYLALNSLMTLQQLQRAFQQFENDCNRQRYGEKTTVKQVTMDIDILLVKLDLAKNSLSNNEEYNWVVLEKRYPFETHEMAGVSELVDKRA